MSASARCRMFLAAALLLGGMLGCAVAGLPAFGRYPGPYGDVTNTVSLYERHLANVVTTVNFDCLGEEFICSRR